MVFEEGGDGSCAADFFLRAGRTTQREVAELDDPSLKHFAEQCFLECDDAVVQKATTQSSALGHRGHWPPRSQSRTPLPQRHPIAALGSAREPAEGAPTTRALLEEERRADAAHGGASSDHHEARHRRWAFRWRKRRRARIGKLAAREVLTQAEMLGKAGAAKR